MSLYETSCCVAIDAFNNQIYALLDNPDRGYFRVFVYSHSGEYLYLFIHDKQESINGMAIHKNNLYIVSGQCHFLHLKVKVKKIASLISGKNDKGSGIGEFMVPRQLDISKEGDLFVTDFGNNRVQILDGNLQYKRHISHHSMLKPCDVKLTPDEVYVLGANPLHRTNCIHIFTHMGEKLRTVILNGIPNCTRSRGFCVDTFGNIIIIDNANSQIKFFTKEGNLFETMHTVSTISILINHKELIGIAWITNQKLVALSKDFFNRLEIFSYF